MHQVALEMYMCGWVDVQPRCYALIYS